MSKDKHQKHGKLERIRLLLMFFPSDITKKMPNMDIQVGMEYYRKIGIKKEKRAKLLWTPKHKLA